MSPLSFRRPTHPQQVWLPGRFEGGMLAREQRRMAGTGRRCVLPHQRPEVTKELAKGPGGRRSDTSRWSAGCRSGGHRREPETDAKLSFRPAGQVIRTGLNPRTGFVLAKMNLPTLKYIVLVTGLTT